VWYKMEVLESELPFTDLTAKTRTGGVVGLDGDNQKAIPVRHPSQKPNVDS
jgi:hypothetical protein